MLNINVEAEIAILNSVVFDESALKIAIENIETKDFLRTEHRTIFEAILKIEKEKNKVDTISIIYELEKTDKLESIGGKDKLFDILNCFLTSANIKQNIMFLKQNRKIYETNKLRDEIAKAKENGKIFDINKVKEKIAEIEKITEIKKENELIDSQTGYFNALEAIEENYKNFKNGKKISGLETGFMDLDDITGGFNKNNLIIIGARPSMGKSAFMLNIAEQASVKSELPVVFYSLEMATKELMFRIISKNSGVSLTQLKNGQLDDEDWVNIASAGSQISKIKILIQDNPAEITINNIRKQCLALKEKEGLGMIVIDYLQLMSDEKRGNRQEEVAIISRKLKLLAIELGIPVVVAVQLNRDCEKRQDKRPMLSDLRESGAIEQDADIVMFLYRDEYYNPETENKNIAEIIISKNRDGRTGKIYLGFRGEQSMFYNVEFENKKSC